MKQPTPKSRKRESVHVHVHMPEGRGNVDPPGYSSHTNGQFEQAGYASGQGQFGFWHATAKAPK